MRIVYAAFLLVLAFPAVARAEDASLFTREVPLGARSLASAEAPARFNLVGVHWRGTGSVELRTRSVSGRWSAWRNAAPEAEDLPDGGSGAWRIGNPFWVGASDRLQVRTRGRVTRVRAHYVWSPPTPVFRRLQIANAPPIIGRKSWGANEKIVRSRPVVASSLRFAIVHHTAGSSSYSRAQSAAVVKGIQTFHVRGNGWNDIGYNFLVDRYGQVFEGRAGGMHRNVIGAHAEGFNTGSVGVALIGNYGAKRMTPAQRDALVRLLAWRLDVAHVDPLAAVTVESLGNAKYRRGADVLLRGVSGHRDTGFTSCPGTSVYRELPPLARAIAQTGGPKLYAPTVTGRLGGKVTFRARLSSVRRWTVTVTDSAGSTIASTRGRGASITWTWDSTNAGRGPFAWRIDGGPTTRPATGMIGRRVPPPPASLLSEVKAEPTTITPLADGTYGSTTLSYALGAPASVTISLTDASGVVLSVLMSETREAGAHTFVFTPVGLADGHYRLVVDALTLAGRVATAQADIVVDSTFSAFTVSPGVFSPNGDGTLDTTGISFTLKVPAHVQLAVTRDAQVLALLFAGDLPPGFHQYTWNGASPLGRVADGVYALTLTATHPGGSVSQTLPLVVDTVAPRLTLLSRKQLRFRLNEPATVTVTIDGHSFVLVQPAGDFMIGYSGTSRTISATAQDAAGNITRTLRSP